MGDAASYTLASLDEIISGDKTFLNQTFRRRNPANTFTGTELNPILTANKDLEPGYNSFGSYIVYKRGTDYVTKNIATNAVDYSGTIAETAISTAITNAAAYGAIELQGNTTYQLSPAFTGFNCGYQQTYLMGAGCRINCPPNYTGSVFKFYNTTPSAGCRFYGGFIEELPATDYAWTAFDIYHDGGSSTTFGHHIVGTKVYAAKNGLALRTNNTGWSNGNLFDGIFITSCVNGVLFEHTGTWTPFGSGCHTNMFSNWIIQYDSALPSDYGIKDVNGQRNVFLNMYVADFVAPHVQMSISPNGSHTQIIGGTCSAGQFTDASPAGYESLIRDQYQGDVAPFRKTWRYEDGVAIAAPASPATGTVRQYSKTIDANNDGRFCKLRVNGAVVEVQTA